MLSAVNHALEELGETPIDWQPARPLNTICKSTCSRDRSARVAATLFHQPNLRKIALGEGNQAIARDAGQCGQQDDAQGADPLRQRRRRRRGRLGIELFDAQASPAQLPEAGRGDCWLLTVFGAWQLGGRRGPRGGDNEAPRGRDNSAPGRRAAWGGVATAGRAASGRASLTRGIAIVGRRTGTGLSPANGRSASITSVQLV